MNEGDLVRCRYFDAHKETEFTMTGILIKYDNLMKRADVLLSNTGTVMSFRANDVQLMKRSPDNVEKLLTREKDDS